MDVDKARRDDTSFGIDDSPTVTFDGPKFNYSVAIDGDICDASGCTGSIDDTAVFDDEIMHVVSPYWT